MHIVIATLGSIVTILWLLHRLADMGIDLGGLNPWAWRRRRKWRSTFEANPVYSITSPMEVTALLVTATAKADGDMSSDEKRAVLQMFEDEFRLSGPAAASLLTSSTHLLGTGDEVRDNLNRVLAPSLDEFTSTQAESAVAMLKEISETAGPPSQLQTALVEQARACLLATPGAENEWT
jgi:hypothetical protein